MLEQILFASGALVIGLLIIAYAGFIAKQPVRPKKPKVKKIVENNKPETKKIDWNDISIEQMSDPAWSFLSYNAFHEDSVIETWENF